MADFWSIAVMIVCGIAAIEEHIGMAVAEFDPIGVVLGTAGNDIPDPKSVVELCHNYGFKKIRISDDNPKLMNALINQNIAVTLDIRNFKLPAFADEYDDVEITKWVRNNVKPYIGKIHFEYIVVGNEAIPGPFGQYIPKVIELMYSKLREEDIASIKLTTAVSTSVLTATIPPSNGAFKAETRDLMHSVIDYMRFFFLKPTLMVNVYPYYFHAAGLIRQDFATFSTHKPVYWDRLTGYWNMLDALLDAFNSALLKENISSNDGWNLVVGASGWPSAGNSNFTTPALAATYNQNLMRRLARRNGTPAQPNYSITGFVYALFNENMKPAGPDQHFGLFNTNKTPAYNFIVPQ